MNRRTVLAAVVSTPLITSAPRHGEAKAPSPRQNATPAAASAPLDPARTALLVMDYQTAWLETLTAWDTDALIDRMVEKRECDFIHDFALPLPVAIICQMLNISLEDQHLFANWSATLLAGLELSADPGEAEKAETATVNLYDYLRKIAEKLRGNPGGDLISTLIEAADEEKISAEEVIWGSITPLVAGHETTTHLLGNGMLALIRNPGQLRCANSPGRGEARGTRRL